MAMHKDLLHLFHMQLLKPASVSKLRSYQYLSLPENVSLSLVPSLALLFNQFPQPTTQLSGFGLRRWLLWRDITPHPCALSAPAALDVLTQRGTLSQELLLPCAPHLVQVDGTFPLTKPSGCNRSTTEDEENSPLIVLSIKMLDINQHINIFDSTNSSRYKPVSELSAHHGSIQVVPAWVANASPLAMEIHLDSPLLSAAATDKTHQGTWQEKKQNLTYSCRYFHILRSTLTESHYVPRQC